MWPYILLVFFPLSYSYLFYEYKRKQLFHKCDYAEIVVRRNKMIIIIFFALFFILLCLRDISIGNDLVQYQSVFEICQFASFNELANMNWEWGYTVYNKVISFISSEYRVFLIITAAVILYPIYKLYSKEKKFGYLLIVIFLNMPCFLMIFSGLRQALAISVGIFVYMALNDKKYVKSVLWLLLAISFHSSAIVLVLLYPAYFFKIKTKHLLYIAPVSAVIFIFRRQIFTFIINFMPSKYVEFYSEIQQTGAIGMLLLFLIFTVFSFVVLEESDMTEKDCFMRNLLLISTLFQFFVPIHGLIQRASYYFLIFAPVSILSIVQAPKRKLKNISNAAVAVMSIFFTLYFFYNAMFSTDNLLGVFPYRFFWSENIWW